MVLGRLIHRDKLDPIFNDHPLQGEWSGHRECHFAPDWLLIYGKDTLGCDVDVATPGSLHPKLRKEIFGQLVSIL